MTSNERKEPLDGQPLDAQSLEVSLSTNDLAASLAWYRDVLGFVIDREFSRDGAMFAVSLRGGAVRVLLTRDDGAKGTDRVKGQGFSLQITTAQNIDALAEQIRARGGVILLEPTDVPSGTRVFRVADPDGVKILFSSPRPA